MRFVMLMRFAIRYAVRHASSYASCFVRDARVVVVGAGKLIIVYGSLFDR